MRFLVYINLVLFPLICAKSYLGQSILGNIGTGGEAQRVDHLMRDPTLAATALSRERAAAMMVMRMFQIIVIFMEGDMLAV